MTLNDFILSHSFHVISFLADASPPTSDGFKTTVVVTAGGVISAALAAFAIIYQKHRDPATDPNAHPTQPIVDPNQASTGLEKYLIEEVQKRDSQLAAQGKKLKQYADFLIDLGYNPNTFKKIRQGRNQ